MIGGGVFSQTFDTVGTNISLINQTFHKSLRILFFMSLVKQIFLFIG